MLTFANLRFKLSVSLSVPSLALLLSAVVWCGNISPPAAAGGEDASQGRQKRQGGDAIEESRGIGQDRIGNNCRHIYKSGPLAPMQCSAARSSTCSHGDTRL